MQEEVAIPKASPELKPKTTNRYDPEPFQSTSDQQNINCKLKVGCKTI
jgi:hypothetical protein